MTTRPWGRTMAVWGISALATFGGVAVGPAAYAGEQGNLSVAQLTSESAASVSARQKLLAEAHSELKAMKRTRYQHDTAVNVAKGEFYYDCSGFLDYALERSAPKALKALPSKREDRPLAEDFVHHLRGVSARAAGPWRAASTVSALSPGDVVAWLVPDPSKSKNTGHVVIVLEPPVRNPARGNEWLIRVVDATSDPHARDSRTGGVTGLGTGTIGLDVDGSGRPVGYFWKGGESKKAQRTEVALGQLR